jgi:hypothetical protein
MTPFTLNKLTTLQEDILRTILYFDIFQHPLTAGEVYRFLPSNSTTPKEVADACQRAPLTTFIHHDKGFYSLSSNGEHARLLKDRLSKEQRAHRYRFIARLMARIIRRFPFVRAVCVSGELSKGVASVNGDIDYLLITANDRLWIARTILILFKKTVLFNSKKYFCLNHFVSERSVESRNRNLYAALEIATLIPLTDYDRYLSYQSANSWIREYLPNVQPNPGDWLVKLNRVSLFQRILEFPMRGKLGDRLDAALREYWNNIWRKRYPQYTEKQRTSLFQCEPDVSTSYAGDFLPKIMTQYRLRLEAFRLQSTSRGI